MHSSDLDDAITMHRAWKMKFHLTLGCVQSRDFDTNPIGDAINCKLGKWLATNSSELASFEPLDELLRIHQEFHHQSQLIADDIRYGNIVSMTDKVITDYRALSGRIEFLLMQLKEAIQRKDGTLLA